MMMNRTIVIQVCSTANRFLLKNIVLTIGFSFVHFADSDDESDCSELFEKKQRDDCNQPDSGFEEKKVNILFFFFGFSQFNVNLFIYEKTKWNVIYTNSITIELDTQMACALC